MTERLWQYFQRLTGDERSFGDQALHVPQAWDGGGAEQAIVEILSS